MLGPRKERVRHGKLIPLRPHSVPFATLGGFLLAVGFFAFSMFRLGWCAALLQPVCCIDVGSLHSISAPDGSGISAMGRVIVNTALAISGGGLTAMIIEKFVNGELSLMITLNGM
jgi:ammonia channel protein AmtB